jgi:hypothetical protein
VGGLAKGERVDLDPGIEEGDFERAVADATGLPDELVESRFGHGSVALLVDIVTACCTGRCPSMKTWKRTDAPVAAGPMTRWRSRAWKR